MAGQLTHLLGWQQLTAPPPAEPEIELFACGHPKTTDNIYIATCRGSRSIRCRECHRKLCRERYRELYGKGLYTWKALRG